MPGTLLDLPLGRRLLSSRQTQEGEGMKNSRKSPISINPIKRSKVKELKAKYKMEDVPDTEFVQWLRRNHGTGYEITIVEG